MKSRLCGCGLFVPTSRTMRDFGFFFRTHECIIMGFMSAPPLSVMPCGKDVRGGDAKKNIAIDLLHVYIFSVCPDSMVKLS